MTPVMDGVRYSIVYFARGAHQVQPVSDLPPTTPQTKWRLVPGEWTWLGAPKLWHRVYTWEPSQVGAGIFFASSALASTTASQAAAQGHLAMEPDAEDAPHDDESIVDSAEGGIQDELLRELDLDLDNPH